MGFFDKLLDNILQPMGILSIPIIVTIFAVYMMTRPNKPLPGKIDAILTAVVFAIWFGSMFALPWGIGAEVRGLTDRFLNWLFDKLKFW